MKKNFGFYVILCFIFAFTFAVSFADDGDPDPPPICWDCCYIPPTAQCSAGWGVEVEVEGICECLPLTGINPKCDIVQPQCQ